MALCGDRRGPPPQKPKLQTAGRTQNDGHGEWRLWRVERRSWEEAVGCNQLLVISISHHAFQAYHIVLEVILVELKEERHLLKKINK